MTTERAADASVALYCSRLDRNRRTHHAVPGRREGRCITEPVTEGALLWTPSAERAAAARLAAFIAWLGERGHRFSSYDALWQWFGHRPRRVLAGHLGLLGHRGVGSARARARQPGDARRVVFPAARLNDAQHVLRREAPGQVALLALSETAPLSGTDWADLAGRTCILATPAARHGRAPR